MAKKTEQRVVKDLPKNERHFVKKITENGYTFHITGKHDRSRYSLYLESEGGFLLIKHAPEPVDFNEVADSWGEEPKAKQKRARKAAQSND